MDFSVSGSDSWETTASQETFIESYFQDQKFPVSSTSDNALKKKRKHVLEVNLTGDNKHCQKQNKSLKLTVEASNSISPQSSNINSMENFSQHPSRKKLKKQIENIPESTEKESPEDSTRSSINDDFQCTENESLQKPKILNNHLTASIKSKLKKKKPEKKLKKNASQEAESLLLKQNTLPQKSKVLKKKVKQSLKGTLEAIKDFQDSKENSEDAFQDSDEELLSEIKDYEGFKVSKLPVEEAPIRMSPQSSKINSMEKFSQHSSRKKLKKRIENIPESTEKASPEDSGSSSINGDFVCRESESLEKPINLNNHLTSIKSKLKKKKPEKKVKKKASQETESLLLEQNTVPQKSKVLKKKVKQSLKGTLEAIKDLPDSNENSEDAFQDSDEELIAEIKVSDIFKDIKKLLKKAPFLNIIKNSDESFNELSSVDSDESLGELSAEDSDESSPEVTNSVLLKTDKESKNVKRNTKLPAHEHKNSFPIETCNADEMKCVPDESSNVGGGFKLQNDEPLIRNPMNSKKTGALSLKNKAQAKLQAAKFRYLNEKFYTETGENAFQYFQENVEEYHDYHQGYSLQVSKWPMNPVNKIISDIQSLKESTVIADMGCGDAKIARTLNKLTVHSFDIVALNEFVTPCDISKVPLPNESVDVVVFCLSLMGTNLKQYLIEAHRILKMGGALKIAEVESRITDVNTFVKGLKCLGFSLQKQDLKHKIFVFLDLKKEKKKLKGAQIPNITLRPCLYKKR